MRGRSRGFTLIEAVVVVAIVAIVAATATASLRAAKRNATVSSTAFELSLLLDGLRARAMRNQRDLVAVVMDAADVQLCATGADRSCGRYALLQPGPGFVLNGIDPGLQAYPNATVVLDEQLPRGLAFYRPEALRAGPPPYDAIRPFDAELVGLCAGRSCVGVRFRGDGSVEPEWPTGVAGGAKRGVAFVLGSDLSGTDDDSRQHLGADQRSVLVTFPTGIVKTFSLAR